MCRRDGLCKDTCRAEQPHSFTDTESRVALCWYHRLSALPQTMVCAKALFTARHNRPMAHATQSQHYPGALQRRSHKSSLSCDRKSHKSSLESEHQRYADTMRTRTCRVHAAVTLFGAWLLSAAAVIQDSSCNTCSTALSFSLYQTCIVVYGTRCYSSLG